MLVKIVTKSASHLGAKRSCLYCWGLVTLKRVAPSDAK